MKRPLIKTKKSTWLIALALLIIVCSALGITMAKYITEHPVGTFDLTVEASEQAFAVYSEADYSLSFYFGSVPKVGTKYNQKTVTAVYTGIEQSGYTPKWTDYAGSIKTVKFVGGKENGKDRSIKPKTMNSWFKDFQAVTSFDFKKLNTSEVTSFYETFRLCKIVTTLDLSGFNTSNAKSMKGMFQGCYQLASLNISSFDTANVTNMENMFSACHSIAELDLAHFNTSKVTDMSFMFSVVDGAKPSLTKLNISNFDTSNVKEMNQMFIRNSKLTSLDLISFDTSNVTTMEYMFSGCSSLERIFAHSKRWNIGKVTISTEMFNRCVSIKGGNGTTYNSNYVDVTYAHIDGLNGLPGYLTEDAKIFAVYGDAYDEDGNSLGKSFNIYNRVLPVGEERITLSGGAYQEIDSFYTNFDDRIYSNPKKTPWANDALDVKAVRVVDRISPTSTTCWFADVYQYGVANNDSDLSTYSKFSNCTSMDLANLDTSNVTDMKYMFYNCSKLPTLDLSNFDTSNVTSMRLMFSGCKKLTSTDLVDSFNTGNVTDMRNMFSSCESLTALDFSGFDTRNVTQISRMFSSAKSLTSLDLRSFDTSKVTDMTQMFDNCNSLTSLDVTSFNTSNVTTMYYMFSTCTELKELDLSSCNTSKVTQMNRMFYENRKLEKIIVSENFVTTKLEQAAGMFTDCEALIGGNGTAYDSRINYNYVSNFKSYISVDGKIVDGVVTDGYFTAADHEHSVDEWIDDQNATTHTGICTIYNIYVKEQHNLVEGVCDKCGYIDPSFFDDDDKEKSSPIDFDISGIDDTYITWTPISDHESMMPYPGELYQIRFEASEGYKLPDTIKVIIDEVEYNVSTVDKNTEDKPVEDESVKDESVEDESVKAEPWFEDGILTIPAELLKENTTLAIIVAAESLTEQPDEETDKPEEEIAPTFGIDVAQVVNAQINHSNDNDGNAVLVITATDNNTLPDEFTITIGEDKEYTIDTTKAEQQDGIVWDAETDTLTIPKDLIEGENLIIGVKLEAYFKEDDENKPEEKPEENENPDEENKDNENTDNENPEQNEQPEDGTTEGDTEGTNPPVTEDTTTPPTTEEDKPGTDEDTDEGDDITPPTDDVITPPSTEEDKPGTDEDTDEGDDITPPTEEPTTPPTEEEKPGTDEDTDEGDDITPPTEESTTPPTEEEKPGTDEDTDEGDDITPPTDDVITPPSTEDNDSDGDDGATDNSGTADGDSDNNNSSADGSADNGEASGGDNEGSSSSDSDSSSSGDSDSSSSSDSDSSSSSGSDSSSSSGSDSSSSSGSDSSSSSGSDSSSSSGSDSSSSSGSDSSSSSGSDSGSSSGSDSSSSATE